MTDCATSIGYFGDAWVPRETIRISLDDVGFRSGVTAVERLRTYRHRVFVLAEHLSRFAHTTEKLGILGLPSTSRLEGLVHELLARNGLRASNDTSHDSSRTSVADSGITMFATPGILGASTPTFGLHLNPLDLLRGEGYRTFGQPISISEVTQPHESTWPRSLKVRCRVHYHLADLRAREMDHDAVGILRDDDGSLTETSICNFAIVKNRTILSPVADQVLGGITQHFIEQIARKSGIDWMKQRIFPDDVYDADEVLLMGTDHGVWFANRVDDVKFSLKPSDSLVQILQRQFHDLADGTT